MKSQFLEDLVDLEDLEDLVGQQGLELLPGIYH